VDNLEAYADPSPAYKRPSVCGRPPLGTANSILVVFSSLTSRKKDRLVTNRGEVGMIVTLCTALSTCMRPSPSPCSVAWVPDAPIGVPVGSAIGDGPGVVFRNEMSSSFRLIRALFVLDGVVLFNARGPDGKSLPSEISLVTDALPAGDHVLQTWLQIRGQGEGSLSYLCGYRFEVKSSHSFTVREGQAFRLDAIAWEKGGNNTPLELRPAIRYVEGVKSIAGRAGTRRTESPNTPAVSGSEPPSAEPNETIPAPTQ
jgi:hypothetical protein